MMDEFIVQMRAQREWNWLIIIAFFCGGVGGGLFLLSSYLDFTLGLAASVILIALGTCSALYFDLGRPQRVLRLFSQVRTSWISRGTLMITIFIVLGILSVLPSFAWFSWLPLSTATTLGQAVRILAMLSAFGVVIYTGFVLSYSPSIPFWNTPLLPIIFVHYSLLGGAAAIFAMTWTTREAERIAQVLAPIEIFLIVATVVLLFSYVATMSYSTVAARESVRLLLAGSLRWAFWGGVVVVGLIVPLALAAYTRVSGIDVSVAVAVLAVVGVLELFGGLLFRYSLLRAGVYVPVI